jgi:hypothetical protein
MTSMFLHNMYQSRVYLVRKYGVSNHPGLMCPLSDYATSVYVYGEAYITTAPHVYGKQTLCPNVTRFSRG